MDFLLEKSSEKIGSRVSRSTKEFIKVISEMKGLNESQYIKLALENQIKADKKAECSKTPQP